MYKAIVIEYSPKADVMAKKYKRSLTKCLKMDMN